MRIDFSNLGRNVIHAVAELGKIGARSVKKLRKGMSKTTKKVNTLRIQAWNKVSGKQRGYTVFGASESSENSKASAMAYKRFS